MPESTGIPQIYLVIEVSQPRKEDDGSTTPAQVESVRSNLPKRYFDIRVVSPEDEVDANGVYTGSTTTYVEDGSPEYEFDAKYAFRVFDPYEYVDAPQGPGKQEEWVVFFGHNDDFRHVLVLGTEDPVAAIERVRISYPSAQIIRVEQAELDMREDSHPTAYLNEHKEILVVGGAAVGKLAVPTSEGGQPS